MEKTSLFSCLLLCSLLWSCTPFVPDPAGLESEKLPDRYSLENIPREGVGDFSLYTEQADYPLKWWRGFESPELDGLIDEALQTNFSVREAWARLLQARYLAVKTGADRYPEVNVQGGVAHTEQESEAVGAGSLDDWTLGFSASYEVDLWGRIRAERTSDALNERASKEDLKTAMMSVTGQIAENWIRLISNRKQQQLFERQLKLQSQLLELITLRFSMAKSTALDIYQQQQSIKNIEEALIPLHSDEKIIERRIALLLGRSSLPVGRLTVEDFPAIRKIPDPGLPADLLAARPDIREAGLRLRSSEWLVAAARAERLPALRLTASHTYTSDQLGSLFDNWLTNLAANLAGPVIDGGSRRAEVERVRAVAEERLAAYSRTVFTAVTEVEDALTEEIRYRETVQSLTEQLELSRRTIREARSRYLNGNSDFLNVLREELNILQVQQDLITSRAEMLIARIQLHLALGGGWVDDYAAEYASRQTSEE